MLATILEVRRPDAEAVSLVVNCNLLESWQRAGDHDGCYETARDYDVAFGASQEDTNRCEMNEFESDSETENSKSMRDKLPKMYR